MNNDRNWTLKKGTEFENAVRAAVARLLGAGRRLATALGREVLLAEPAPASCVMLEEAAVQVERRFEQVQRARNILASRLEDVDRQVARGMGGAFGELQGAGSALDVTTARFDEALIGFGRLLWVVIEDADLVLPEFPELWEASP